MPAIVLTFFILFLGHFSFAGKGVSQTTSTPEQKTLTKCLAQFKKNDVSFYETEKTMISSVLEKKEISTGTIFFTKGKFKFSISQPSESIIIFDGKKLWTMQKLADGTSQYSQSNGEKSDAQLIFKLFSGQIKIPEDLEVTKAVSTKSNSLFDMRTKGAQPVQLRIEVANKTKQLKSIQFTDDIGNTTELKLHGFKKITNPSKDLFKMQVPKGVEVIEL